MIRVISSLSPRKLHVVPLSSLLPTLLTKCRFSSSTLLSQSSLLNSQPLCFSGISQSVLSRSPNMFLDKENGKGKNFDHNVIYKDFLLEISDLVPELARRFRRVSMLRPQDVLEILLGSEFECERVGSRAGKVVSLWKLFKWVNEQNKGFNHLPQSWEVMSRVLVRFGLFREVELLLLAMDSRGIWLGCNETLSNLIKGYVRSGDSNKAISMYFQMKHRGLAPTFSCYHALLGHLIQKRKTQVVFRVCTDMVEMRIGSNESTKTVLDGVIRLLCADGKIQEARNLVRKVMNFGFDANSLDINGIVYGYCEKKDFDDILSLYHEIKHPPDILAGNRIVHLMCSCFNTESAQLFMEELESLGFIPDEITFGILIGWCCQEGRMRSAFAYLEEIFSRGLKPHRNSYNAIICGLFLKGVWKYARDVFDEMVEKGYTPDLLTFQILLAGYCRGREFDEVKKTVSEMENRGLLQTASLDGQFSRAFSVLGFDPLTVKMKRDNDLDFSKSDFFDELGNGFYLDTDLIEYERRVMQILESSLVLDYNSLIMKQCIDGEMKYALALADEMIQWGQELSLAAFSVLLKGLFSSRDSIQVYANVLDKNSKLFDLLDVKTLNLLVQIYCMRGWTVKGKLVLDSMFRRGIKIDNETFTAIITSLCQNGNFMDLHYWWGIARNERWVPQLENCKALLQCLCGKKMLKESLELLEIMLESNSHLWFDISHLFLENLSYANFSRVVGVLLEELIQRGCAVDRLAYSHVMSGMCKEKEFSSALKMLDCLLVKNKVPSPEIVVSLIPQLCIAGRHKEAISLKEMSLRENPISSFLVTNALLKGFCMTTKVGEAIAVLQDMFLKGIVPTFETYDILVEGFCKVNNFAKVRELLGLMIITKRFRLSIRSYRNLVRSMCLEGKVSQALKLKELILGKSESDDLVIYNVLIFQLFSTGNSLFVDEVLDDLQKKQMQLDEVSFNFLVYGFSKCRDVSRALEYLSAMISKELRPNNRSLRAAITTLCGSMEIEKALSLSREMELRGWLHDSVVQNSIAECLIYFGKISEAEKFLDRIAEKKLVPEKIDYNNLIKSFCSCERPKKAIDLINTMLKNGTIPSSASYDSIIVSFCASNNLDGAMDFQAEMLDRDLRPSVAAWSGLVHRFCQQGWTEEAEGLLVSMVGVGETPTRDMFTSVIGRYHFENNPGKASRVIEVMQRSGFEPDFETHWSIIGSLRKSNNEADKGTNKGFLSRLLSDSGFFDKKRFPTPGQKSAQFA